MRDIDEVLDGELELEEPRGRREGSIDWRDTRARAGLALMGAGLLLVLVTWLQIRDVQNEAAQIPYIVSGGLTGIALIVVGGIALFAGDVKLRGQEGRDLDRLAGQVDELAATVRWTADVVEQIAVHLNEGATHDAGNGLRKKRAVRRVS